MKRSESRILTTHTGSLPRSPELQEVLRSRLEPQTGEEQAYVAAVDDGVVDDGAVDDTVGSPTGL
mgnify:CR=1 FL=1